MQTYWALILLLAILCPLPSMSANSLRNPLKPLVVVTRNVPPFAIQREDRWDGLTIELWTLIAERLGRPFELRNLVLTHMLTALEEGSANVAAAALTITSDRETRVDFAHPFISSGLGIALHQRPDGGWLTTPQRLFSTRPLSPRH